MPNPYFRFKQFTVRHDQCAMKVGTDGVLLGAWSDVEHSRRMLDIGTGTGLIALMLAQRSDADREAIDIDEAACRQAEGNVAESPFAGRIHITHASLSDFCKQRGMKYDRIVSNPPYFVNSLKCPDQQRNTARHTDTLSIDELMESAAGLLLPEGRFSVILPYDQRELLLTAAGDAALFLQRETLVTPTPGAAPKRVLAEFGLQACCSPGSTTLTIEIARHTYTDDYIALTKDFYLKM